MQIDQGDVFWVELLKPTTQGSEQEGQRPWVVVSRGNCNRNRVVVAVPLTSKPKPPAGFRIAVSASMIVSEPGSGFHPVDSIALCDQVRALDIGRLQQRIAKLAAPARISVIELGLAYLFDIR